MLRAGRVLAETFRCPKQRSHLLAVTPAATTTREDGGEPASSSHSVSLGWITSRAHIWSETGSLDSPWSLGEGVQVITCMHLRRWIPLGWQSSLMLCVSAEPLHSKGVLSPVGTSEQGTQFTIPLCEPLKFTTWSSFLSQKVCPVKELLSNFLLFLENKPGLVKVLLLPLMGWIMFLQTHTLKSNPQ